MPGHGGFETGTGSFAIVLNELFELCFAKRNGGITVTESVTNAAPRGGMARISRRVMNLAHMLTQNARRHGDRTGFVWGEKSWTWREIDGHLSALAAALAARGVV